MKVLSLSTLILLMLSAELCMGQEAATPGPLPPPETRVQAIQQARQARAQGLKQARTHPVINAAEQFVSHGLTVWNALQSGTHGLSANIGGLAVGSQIAIGPEYVYRFGDYYQPTAISDTYAVAAGDKSFRLQTGLQMPRLARGHAFFALDTYRYEYTQLLYFGPGSNSSLSGRSDYSQRESGADIRMGVAVRRHLRAGILGSFRQIAIGPGSASGARTTDSVYSVGQARGLDRQTSFLTGGLFVEVENRDQPGDPRSGQYLYARFQNVNGSRRALGGFDEYDFDGQVYVPIWNRSHTFAFRTRASFTTPHAGTFVPFYLEPRLGGSDDLRGFESFRFHDQNSIVATAEYRWSVIPVMDMALFADAGKVYHDSDRMTLNNFMSDVGVGLRARTGKSVPFRLDIGVSREGAQVWLTVVDLF